VNHREKAVWCTRIDKLDGQDRITLCNLLDDMMVAAAYNRRVVVVTNSSPRPAPNQ